MPMGFYQPAQIVIDARKHGVEIRPIDINFSCWDNMLEQKNGKYCPIRIGFRQIRGLHKEEIQVLVSARSQPFTSIPALKDAGLSRAALERLADADAFRSIGLDRRQALWEVSALDDSPTGMFAGQPSATATDEQHVQLPVMGLSEHVMQDYRSTSLSLKAHPVSFVRDKLFQLQILPSKELGLWPDGTLVKVAGLVLVRQRPGTASGICFITIEDESGTANLVVFPKLFDAYRKEILQSRLLMVEGKLQREREVTHVVVTRCFNISGLLQKLTETNKAPLVQTLSRADEQDGSDHKHKDARVQKVVQAEIFYGGRNFR